MTNHSATTEVSGHDLSRLDSEQCPETDRSNLRRVPDSIPWVVLLILIVELGERFTYFGLSAPIQNYIKYVMRSCSTIQPSLTESRNPYHPGSDLPGALGRGQAVATALGNFFKFWAYASTVIGAIIADQYLGRFKTIAVACGIYIIGLVILVATSTPAGFESGAGFGGLITAMVVIGLGTGSIKANVTPMCAEQYRPDTAYTKQLKSGEWVVVDPELTVERMFNWCVASSFCATPEPSVYCIQVLLGGQCRRALSIDHGQRRGACRILGCIFDSSGVCLMELATLELVTNTEQSHHHRRYCLHSQQSSFRQVSTSWLSCHRCSPYRDNCSQRRWL